MIRLFLIEDHALIIEGVRNRFRPSRDGIDISGSASTVSEAIQKGKLFDFDIILLDLWIPGSEPADNVMRLTKEFPGKPIIMLTGEDSPYWKQEMLHRGVKAYLLKNADKTKIKKTIEGVLRGDVETVEPTGMMFTKPDQEDWILQKYHLKPTEKEIVRFVSQGLSQKEIAEVKSITVWAIEKTLKKIRKQFNVKSNAEVIHILTALKEL